MRPVHAVKTGNGSHMLSGAGWNQVVDYIDALERALEIEAEFQPRICRHCGADNVTTSMPNHDEDCLIAQAWRRWALEDGDDGDE